MEQEFLKSSVDVQPSTGRDINAPFSFIEWKQQKPTVPDKDLFLYYNRYVLEWFDKNKQKKISNKFLLRQKYLFLLDQLQLFFTTEEKNNWYSKINLSDDKELLLGIPYFAKKLKKIALYYLKLRKKLKNVKIKYNSIGSVQGIEKEIYQHIIENFSSSNTEFDPEFQNILPAIETLRNQLTIKVEELYDDGEYMDKSLSTPLSSYVDIFHEPTAKLFSTKGIVLSSDDWIFKTFSYPTSSTVDAFVAELTSVVFNEQTDTELYTAYVQQYLAENKTNLIFQNDLVTTETYDVSLQQGNNYFFYPYGTTDTSLSIETPLTPITLSSYEISNATAGDTLSSADTIFVKNGDDVKAAWLYFKEFQDENEDVVCLLNKNSTTSFIFPFPGYGLSAEDVDWTGPSLETEDEYQFLPPLIKASVNEAYWSQVLPEDSSNQLNLHETTLADDGAKAGKNPTTADNIFIRSERTEDTTIPRGSLSGAWLYKFERAAIPVSTNSAQSNIALWPYGRVDEHFANETFLNTLVGSDLSNVCAPVPVELLDCSYFVAASSFELADKIFKIESYNKSNLADATECCWLSSAEVIVGDYKHNKQMGVSYLFPPFVATRFVWSGPTMSLNSVFEGIEHSKDCEFFEEESNESCMCGKSASTNNVNTLAWQKCSCKQTYYSPFGHAKTDFETGNRHADFICEDSEHFSVEFDLDSWIDSSDQGFKTSNQFAWYKTDKRWGKGTWCKASGSTSTMNLINGKSYIYRRAGTRTDTEHPSYVVFKKFYRDHASCSSGSIVTNTKWVAAKKLDTGEWQSTNEESKMTLYPGDFVNFQKQQSTTSVYLSTVFVEQVSENRGSIWSSFDFISYDSPAGAPVISWPFVEGPFLLENYEKQAPPIAMQSISAIVAWKVQCKEDLSVADTLESSFTYSELLSTNIYTNTFSFTFVPPQTGTYAMSVTAVDNDFNTYIIPQQSENRGSVWASCDFICYDSFFSSISSVISWPAGAPPIATASLSAIVAWKVQNNETHSVVSILESPFVYDELLSTNVYDNIFSFTFVPPQTGTYAISVTAVDNNYVTYIFPNNTTAIPDLSAFLSNTAIPDLSVVPQFKEEKQEISFDTPQASTLVEHPLSGWKYSISDDGARPYWAILDSEKTPATKFKGIKEWGYENTFFDEYIPNALPKLSPLVINYGNVVEYERKGRGFFWTQPIVYRTFFNAPQWCKLTYDTSSSSNLSSVFDIGLNDTLKVFPSVSATDIILSNNLNGAPVEIFYYALNSFVWTTSATTVNEVTSPEEVVYFTANSSGLNLTNRFYPTVAVLPTLERTYTEKQVGSYFTSQNLGASQYINTNFTAELKTPELSGSYIVEDTSIHIGGRGLTYEEQPTLYNWKENNEWLKEPPISNGLAGSVKKELTKTLQTFIPYQANLPQTALGMITPDSKFSPWGGTYADEWIDKTNEPIGYTGVRNVSAWEASQQLNRSQQQLDAWVNDIYGNQYGLFKSLSSTSIWERPYIPGDLWVKTNGGTVQPASIALSSLYVQFLQNSTVYNDLTSNRVLNIDCFFDTLMIETSSSVILSKITYDYETDKITINTDDSKHKLLSADKFEFNQTWFMPQEKNIVCMFTEVSSDSFFPVLYTYNLNTTNLVKVFPVLTEQYNSLKTALSAYNYQDGKFCYNSATRTYGITYHCLDSNDDIVFANIKLNRLEDLELDTIDIYENRTPYQINTMPPIVLTNYLSAVQVATNAAFTVSVSAYNNPTSYELILSGPGSNQITVNNSGTFTGNLTANGLYHINYFISNEIGTTQYCLTLSAT